MQNITVLKVYNLLDGKGNRLRLRLGILNPEDRTCKRDAGFRWSFVGPKIPMPVRSETWFNGFPVDTMLLWLREKGWFLRTAVDMFDGRATVYPLSVREIID